MPQTDYEDQIKKRTEDIKTSYYSGRPLTRPRMEKTAGEWFTEKFPSEHPDPEVAKREEDRVKTIMEYTIPDTPGELLLAATGGVLAKGAFKLGAPLIKPIIKKVKQLYHKTRGMMDEQEVSNLTRALSDIQERASQTATQTSPTTRIPEMTVQPGRTLVERTTRGPSGTSSFTDELTEAATPPRETYRDIARQHQDRFNRESVSRVEDVQGNIVGRNVDDLNQMTDAQFGEEFGNIADDFIDDIQPTAADLGHNISTEGMEEIADGLFRVRNQGVPLPKGHPEVYKMVKGQGHKGIPKIKVAQEKGVFNKIEYPAKTGTNPVTGIRKTYPGRVLIEHSTPVGPGKMHHSYRLQDPDAFKKVMKKNPDLNWTKGPNKTAAQKEMNQKIRELIIDEDLSRMTFFTDVLDANPQIIGSKPLVQIKGLNFYTGTKNVKNAQGEWVKELIGTGNSSGKIMSSIFDRFPDNWIITTQGRNNTFTLDSFKNMIGGVLKRAEQMKFHSGTGSSSYTQLNVSREGAFSKYILKATGPEGRTQATNKVVNDIIKQLEKASRTSEIVGKPHLSAGAGAVNIKHFTIRHMKEALAGVFGLSVDDMGELLHDMDGVPDSKSWENQVMSGEEYF